MSAKLTPEQLSTSAQNQMAFQERMSNTAHQREVADLKAAGLNPVLSAGGNGASTPTGAEGDLTGVDDGSSQVIRALTASIATNAKAVNSFSESTKKAIDALEKNYKDRTAEDAHYIMQAMYDRQLPYVSPFADGEVFAPGTIPGDIISRIRIPLGKGKSPYIPLKTLIEDLAKEGYDYRQRNGLTPNGETQARRMGVNVEGKPGLFNGITKKIQSYLDSRAKAIARSSYAQYGPSGGYTPAPGSSTSAKTHAAYVAAGIARRTQL